MLLGLLPARLLADPYVGYFVGDLDGRQYRLDMDRVNSTTYDGILRIGDERMQLDARRFGEVMGGRLANESTQLRFRAHVEGGLLILETDDVRRIVLRRGQPE